MLSQRNIKKLNTKFVYYDFMSKFYDLAFLHFFFCYGTFLLLIRHNLFSFVTTEVEFSQSSFIELVPLDMSSSFISFVVS